MLKLLLVRHGESVGNQQGRMEGQASTGLSERGWQQAGLLGNYLATHSWHPTHVYCSPLLRAAQTLEGMAAAFGGQLAGGGALPVQWEPDLMEYDNGCLQGLTWQAALQQYPELCQQLESSLDWLPIPEAETPSQGRSRSAQFWRRVLNAHQNGDRLWVISHHWLLQQLISVVLGCDRTWGMTIGHTACFELWIDCDRWAQTGENRWNSELWQLRRFNDCKHLDG